MCYIVIVNIVKVMINQIKGKPMNDELVYIAKMGS